MARTAIATLQTVWGCRWSQPLLHLERPGVITHLEETWVCTRDGQPHVIDPHNCETCPFFDEQTGDAASVVQTQAPATIGALPAIAPRPSTVDRLAYAAAWVLVALSAGAFFSAGFSILTTPLAVPVTLALWVTGAAIVGFALTAGLPRPD
jgi:hypothetical protein